MTIVLSHREQKMLAAVIKEMGGLPSVDYAKVAMVTGQKYSKNARSAFKRIWDKLRGGPVATSGGQDSTKPVRKTPARATAKKSVGPKKAPRKASTKGRAARRSFKKEDSVEETDESIKADPNEESDDEVVIKTERYDEGGSGQEDDEAPNYEDGHYSDKDIPEMDNDEAGAYLLGVPLEEYRELAKETGHREECREFAEEVDDKNYAAYAPTPLGPTFSDDDAA